MKDLDELLRSSSAPRPRRELSSNFTATVVSTLKAHPQKRQKESRFMKLIHSPVFAVVAAAILLIGGGTAYAATDGFTKPFDLKNIFGYQKIVQPDGRRVLTIKTANCSTGTADAQTATTSDRMLYYRLNDASLVESEVLDFLQGYCEYYHSIMSSDRIDPRDYMEPREGYTYDAGKVIAVKGNTITIKSTTPVVTTDYTKTNSTIMLGAAETNKTIEAGDFLNFVYDDTKPGNPLRVVERYSKYYTFYQDAAYSRQSGTPSLWDKLQRVEPCQQDGKAQFCDYGSKTANTSDSSEAKEAVSTIKTAYDTYIKDLASDRPVGSEEPADDDWPERFANARKQFYTVTTQKLAQTLSEASFGADTILCTQNWTNEITQMSYGAPMVAGLTVTVPISRPNVENKVVPFVDVTYSLETKKIVSIDCLNH